MFTQPFEFELLNPYHKMNEIIGYMTTDYHSMNDLVGGNIHSSFHRLN